jgi:hypothetical protein
MRGTQVTGSKLPIYFNRLVNLKKQLIFMGKEITWMLSWKCAKI